MSNPTIIRSCEVCGSTDLVPVLDLGDQPMCDDLVPIGSNAVPHAYPLRLLGCNRCITVHQAVQVEKKLLFPQSYHYRAALTQDVQDGMRELVADVEKLTGGFAGLTVLDIGCNDGSLLSHFRARGAKTAGIEPTGAYKDATPKVDWIHHGYFDAAAVDAYLENHSAPDIVTFTNVFAHIEDLNGLIENLKRLIGPRTKLVIENHYLGAVVARAQFDTFYHEHPRTYSLQSFKFIAEKLGLNLEECSFPARYNGNIRVVMGHGAVTQTTEVDESNFIRGVEQMQPLIAQGRERILSRLAPLVKQYGPLPAKAFPGRASILIHCFQIDETLIDATYERSSSPKIGNYVPGTRIEIRDEEELFCNRIDSPVLVNLAWHIESEIEQYVRSKGFRGEMVSIFE